MSARNTYIELAVEVAYDFTPGCRGARDSLGGKANAGPPLEPDDPPELTVTSVMLGSVEIIGQLTDEQVNTLAEECLEHHEEPGPDPDDERDRMMDERMRNG